MLPQKAGRALLAAPATTPQPVEIPPDVLLAQKLAQTTLGTKHSARVDWKNHRIVTPGQLVVVKDKNKNKEIVGRVKEKAATVFTNPKGLSQGLIHVDGRAAAATATTAIKNPNVRTEEQHSTFIQFDKTRIHDRFADFEVPQNRKKPNKNGVFYSFYSGCHLIDYQFIAGDAHTDSRNYFPGNYFYNSSIRNWLVNPARTAAYLEIPVYTPNPPEIESLRSHGNYPIPVCLFFIRIRPTANGGKNPVVIYCFPNNSYDYEDTKQYLGLKKKDAFGKKMAPYFALNQSFLHLLKPAIIHTLKDKQLEKEPAMAELLKDLMGVEEVDPAIYELGRQVAESRFEPTLLLPHCKKICNAHLEEALNFAAEFLVKYAIRNSLKAEVFTIKARLTFINSMAGCMATHTYVIVPAHIEYEASFKDEFEEDFENALDELPEPSELEIDDQILLCSTYLKMTAAYTLKDHPEMILVCGLDVDSYCATAVEILQLLNSGDPTQFSAGDRLAYLKLIHEAQKIFVDFEDWEFEDLGEFLYENRDLCQKLLTQLTPAQKRKYSNNWIESFSVIGQKPN